MACIKPYIENQKSTYNTIDISDLVQQVQIGYNKKKEFYFCIYTKKTKRNKYDKNHHIVDSS